MAAHVGHGGSGSIQIRADQITPILGIKPAEMLVEPTRSQNITVTCRRSPTASATGGALGVADGRAGAAVTDGVCALASPWTSRS